MAPGHHTLKHLTHQSQLGTGKTSWITTRSYTSSATMWKSDNPSLQVLTQSTVSGIGVSQQQKPKNKRNLDKRDSDSFPQHNKEGMNSVVTCCYVGSSVHLLILRNNMYSCITSIKSSDTQNLQLEIKPQKHVSAITQSSQIIQTCKVPLKSKWKSDSGPWAETAELLPCSLLTGPPPKNLK